MSHEPQITEIASYLAAALPVDGTPHEDTKQAWRHSLRYARKSGAIEPLVDMIRSEVGTAPIAEEYCDQLTR